MYALQSERDISPIFFISSPPYQTPPPHVPVSVTVILSSPPRLHLVYQLGYRLLRRRRHRHCHVHYSRWQESCTGRPTTSSLNFAHPPISSQHHHHLLHRRLHLLAMFFTVVGKRAAQAGQRPHLSSLCGRLLYFSPPLCSLAHPLHCQAETHVSPREGNPCCLDVPTPPQVTAGGLFL